MAPTPTRYFELARHQVVGLQLQPPTAALKSRHLPRATQAVSRLRAPTPRKLKAQVLQLRQRSLLQVVQRICQLMKIPPQNPTEALSLKSQDRVRPSPATKSSSPPPSRSYSREDILGIPAIPGYCFALLPWLGLSTNFLALHPYLLYMHHCCSHDTVWIADLRGDLCINSPTECERSTNVDAGPLNIIPLDSTKANMRCRGLGSPSLSWHNDMMLWDLTHNSDG